MLKLENDAIQYNRNYSSVGQKLEFPIFRSFSLPGLNNNDFYRKDFQTIDKRFNRSQKGC